MESTTLKSGRNNSLFQAGYSILTNRSSMFTIDAAWFNIFAEQHIHPPFSLSLVDNTSHYTRFSCHFPVFFLVMISSNSNSPAISIREMMPEQRPAVGSQAELGTTVPLI